MIHLFIYLFIILLTHYLDLKYIKMCVEISTFQQCSQEFDPSTSVIKIPSLFTVCQVIHKMANLAHYTLLYTQEVVSIIEINVKIFEEN